MADEDAPPPAAAGPARRFARRRRRANVVGGRQHSHRVLVTPEEEARLVQLAGAQRVSVPRLLVESALSGSGETPTQRREAMAELFAVRRLLAGVSNNVNQVARHANAGDEFPPDAVGVLGGCASGRGADRRDDRRAGLAVMPNITRGQRMGGLLVYLAGPGRANEHTDPHLVVGDPAIMAWHDDAVLDRDAALAVARQVDHPRRAFGVEVPGGAVWHCSLSLAAAEGQLSDEKWGAIAHDFVTEMGFAGGDPTTGGKAACRWVAVRHGASGAGNDHVHVAVSLVREDGTKASVWNDRPRAQRVAGELEKKYGLAVLESRQVGLGSRGVKPGEVATAARRGDPEPARAHLARTVRGCAAAAADEPEFVRRVRQAGLLVRPRYAAGRDDVVAGYSVARRPPAGERSVWYGGGHLARDLTLPRLRSDWPDTPQHAAAAVAEWNAGRRGRRPVAPGREMSEPDPALWEQHTTEVTALRETLRGVPVEDRATWARVAKETAGAFAAWSLRVEASPGPLAATADSLARSAQLRAHEVQPRRAGLPSARGAALLLASVAHGGTGTVAQAVLLRQLANTAKALHDAHQAAGQARRAAEIADVVRGQLATVRAGLPGRPSATASATADTEAAEAVRIACAGQLSARVPGSPLPTPLEGQRRATAAGRPGRATTDTEVER